MPDMGAPMNLIDKPIDDIDSLILLANDDKQQQPRRRRIPLPNDHSLPSRRRILVCHDMQNGYLHDRFSQGCDCPDVYTLIYCQLVDIFVYFSHHLITLPPAQWIDLCHANGIPVLGTLITEGDSGDELCKTRLFRDEYTATQLAHAMAKISQAYQFDGWFINIENPLDPLPTGGGRLACTEVLSFIFLPTLKKLLNGGHLMWYDAVTCAGDLDWQNSLNRLNQTFFDVCDGIVLNYSWTIDDLCTSRQNSRERRLDVYAGVDVFARGCIGGFDTPLAMKKVCQFDLSTAIFAPGWIRECLEESRFLDNQRTFWTALSEMAFPKRVSQLPFATCFCTGRGRKFHTIRAGNRRIVCPSAWSYLPMTTWIPSDGNVIVTEADAFIGGSCLQLSECQPTAHIADFDLPIGEIEVCFAATTSGTIVVTLEYVANEGTEVMFLMEHNATRSRRMDEWLWTSHLLKLKPGARLRSVYANLIRGEGAKLGLLTLEQPYRAEDCVVLSPTVWRLRQQDNRLYVIVRVHNPRNEIVNAYLDGEEGNSEQPSLLLASSTEEHVCILFELVDDDAADKKGTALPPMVQLAFSRWRALMLNPIGCNFERLQLQVTAGKRMGRPVYHVSDEEEQIFIEMFRSVS